MKKIFQPPNDNIIQLSKFTFTIPTLIYTNYYCQEAKLPGMSTSPPEKYGPFATMKHHGDTSRFDPLNITVLCDEDLIAWEETIKWFFSLTKPNTFLEYDALPRYHDAVLTPHKNSNLPNLKIKFHNIHPVAITGLNFDTKVSAEAIATFDVQFIYDVFEIDRD